MGQSAVDPGTRTALTIRVTGLVQGVGFRPFVHRLATRLLVHGTVRNASGAVEIVAEGEPAALDGFVTALRRDAPPLARIDAIESRRTEVTGLAGFTILASTEEPGRRQPVSPDVATCARCEAELFDPADPRYRYPFITCTDCGPRFTVIEAMPYDRERTSMRAFTQCPDCRAEYESPGHRRFHSETNSCPRCGPSLWLEEPGVAGPARGEDAILRAARLLQTGKIVAVRGLGGFHLAVDATDAQAVARLRERKHRDARPLAVMVRTLEQARELATLSDEAVSLLTAPARPIVVVRHRADAPLAGAVSPGLDTVGIMLAYTPLHHLLLEAAGRPLVMTSGNRSDEPIATGNDDARRDLRWIADAFLLHNREIVARYDDSVVREGIVLRRARGYAPLPLELPVESPVPVLAVGGHLKHTFTLVHGSRAYTSQHIGDLESPETLGHFMETLRRYRLLFRIDPAAGARDLHPDYLSSSVVDEIHFARLVPVQHHHAHIAAVLAEHGYTGEAVGISYDGTGLGQDGAIWGSEMLIADLAGYRRVGHLRYARLPGGDLAARQPWRAALAYLSLDHGAEHAFRRAFVTVDPRELSLARQQIEHRLNSPPASSMGRLFDAAAAVLGLRAINAYEGQAAMELESLAGRRAAAPLPLPAAAGADGWIVDPLPLLAALGEARAAGHAVEDLAAAFHESVAATTADVGASVAADAGLSTVALGGGVFQNARLLRSVSARLRERGLTVLTARALPPNDGGLSYGQAAVAATLLARELGG